MDPSNKFRVHGEKIEPMTKTRFLASLIIICLFAFRIWQTTGCRQFSSFYFNPLSIKINVESNIASDLGIERNISRFFHNKVTSGIFELTKSFTSTFNLRFLLELLGPLGLILTVSMIIRIIKKREITAIGHFGIILVASMVAIVPVNPKTAFSLFALAWYSFAARGIAYFSQGVKFWIIFIALSLFSFRYFIYSWQMLTICNDIFFN